MDNIKNVTERIFSISINTKLLIFTLIQVYATQIGKPSLEKDQFCQDLQDITDTAGYKEKLIVCRDYNGHIGCVIN